MDVPVSAIDRIMLERVNFYAQTTLPRGVLRHATHVESFVEHESQHLIYMLRSAVLGEEGGREVSDWVTVLLPLRPWWLPKFLWRRIPTRQARWELRARPMWTYPHSNIQVPNLGSPVEIAVNQGLTHGNGEWCEG